MKPEILKLAEEHIPDFEQGLGRFAFACYEAELIKFADGILELAARECEGKPFALQTITGDFERNRCAQAIRALKAEAK